MNHTPPVVTIDLAEYNELIEIKKQINKETISDESLSDCINEIILRSSHGRAFEFERKFNVNDVMIYVNTNNTNRSGLDFKLEKITI